MSSEASGGVTIKEEASTSGAASNNSGEATGAEAKKLDSAADKAELQGEACAAEETPETHLKRLQNLRKELGYLSETDWMYESLDKKPAQ